MLSFTNSYGLPFAQELMEYYKMVHDKWLNYGKINVSVSSGSFLIWFLEACVYLDCMDIFILACAQPKITRIDCRQKYLAHNSWLGSSNQKVEWAGWILDGTQKYYNWIENDKIEVYQYFSSYYVSHQKNKYSLMKSIFEIKCIHIYYYRILECENV